MDWAWPEEKLCLEVEGGVWIHGGHTRGSGFVNNLEKYNRMAEMGWRLIRVQPKDLLTRETARLIASCLNIKISVAYEQKAV